MNDYMQEGPMLQGATDNAAATLQGKRTYNRLGWAFMIFLVTLLVLPNLAMVIISRVNPALLSSPFFGMPLNYTVMYGIGFPLMLLSLRGVPDAPALPEVQEAGAGKKMRPLELLALYPVLYAIVGLVSIATTAFEAMLGTAATTTVEDIMAMPLPQWALFALGVFVAPIMEEIVFRRLVYKKASGYGKGAYVLWSAVIFGLFHLNFGQSIYAAALGAIFAIVMLKTGSVLYTAILHMAINLTGGIGLGSIILASGNEPVILIYSIYLYALMITGIVIGILMIKRRRAAKEQQEKQRELPIIQKKAAFLNPGSLVYCVACLAIIISGFFM